MDKDTGQNKSNEQGKDKDAGSGSGSNSDILEQLAKINEKIDTGKSVSAEDEKIIAALLANDSGSNKTEKDSDSDSYKQSKSVDEMSRVELVDHMSKVMREEFNASNKNLIFKLDEANQKIIEIEIDKEISFARGKYGKSFEEAWGETAKVADKHPELTAEECYLLATGKKTLTELGEKIKKENEDTNKKKALLGASSFSSADNEALLENLSGKSVQDVAMELAGRLGL